MRLSGASKGILYVAFNQDYSRIAVGTHQGFRIYSVGPELKSVYVNSMKDTSIVEALFGTRLLAHVSAGHGQHSQRILSVLNTKTGKEIVRMNFSGTILSVKLNRKILVAVLESSIYIYDTLTMKLAHDIGQARPNPAGICALSSGIEDGGPERNYLAILGHEEGQVVVYDALNQRSVATIEAHDSPIACLAFSRAGDKLATASAKGTVFRVFSCPEGTKLFEFRRSVKSYATIHSMAFDAEGKLLCVTSDKPTVHIFKLEEERPPEPQQDASWGSYFRGAVSSATAYLPTQVSDMWTQARSFAQITLPESQRTECAIVNQEGQTLVLIATEEGRLYRYQLDVVAGGECKQLGSLSLCEDDVIPAAAAAAAAAAAPQGRSGSDEHSKPAASGALRDMLEDD